MQTDFQSQRVKMVDGQLRTTDVTNHEILRAFLSVRREMFVNDARRDLAYLDDDIQITVGRYMMEPAPLAKLMQLANVLARDKVLIIGSGSGYSAAVLSQIASSVVALENDEALVQFARAATIAEQVTNVEFLCGALIDGAQSRAPFDVILIEGSVSSVPITLLDQLSPGGRLIAVEGSGPSGVANCYAKVGSTVSVTRGFNLAVKPLPEFQKRVEFAF